MKETEFIGINKMLLLLEIVDTLDNHPSLQKITDEDGVLVIPSGDFEDFGHDFGLIIGRIVLKICEPYDRNK